MLVGNRERSLWVRLSEAGLEHEKQNLEPQVKHMVLYSEQQAHCKIAYHKAHVLHHNTLLMVAKNMSSYRQRGILPKGKEVLIDKKL